MFPVKHKLVKLNQGAMYIFCKSNIYAYLCPVLIDQYTNQIIHNL